MKKERIKNGMDSRKFRWILMFMLMLRIYNFKKGCVREMNGICRNLVSSFKTLITKEMHKVQSYEVFMWTRDIYNCTYLCMFMVTGV